jgi:hypothetical protein
MNRKKFFLSAIGGIYGASFLPNFLNAQTAPQPEPLNSELVKEFVGAGHNDLPKVQSMLKENPNLIFCMYDWGGGDFETAIEGAGHVGDKDIANFLIGEGARVNIFALTMLGKTQIVKPVLEVFPNLIFSKGPHGFTLLHHAKVGEKDSEELYDYVQSKGLTEMKMKIK